MVELQNYNHERQATADSQPSLREQTLTVRSSLQLEKVGPCALSNFAHPLTVQMRKLGIQLWDYESQNLTVDKRVGPKTSHLKVKNIFPPFLYLYETVDVK